MIAGWSYEFMKLNLGSTKILFNKFVCDFASFYTLRCSKSYISDLEVNSQSKNKSGALS